MPRLPRLTPTHVWIILITLTILTITLSPSQGPGLFVPLRLGTYAIRIGFSDGRAVLWTSHVGPGWGWGAYNNPESGPPISSLDPAFGHATAGYDSAAWFPAWLAIAVILLPLIWWTAVHQPDHTAPGGFPVSRRNPRDRDPPPSPDDPEQK